LKKKKMGEQQKTLEVQIEIDDVTAQGSYANLAMITHSETEFIFDFIFVQPQAPKAKIRARIITSPIHAKRFLRALEENIKKYEATFGPLPETKTPIPRPIGFA
jgi:hypothetical protein